MATAGEVADWMVKELGASEYLYQEVAVYKIKGLFGEEFVYANANGNLAISRSVLAEFRKRREGKVVWSRGERLWREKESYDVGDRVAE